VPRHLWLSSLDATFDTLGFRRHLYPDFWVCGVEGSHLCNSGPCALSTTAKLLRSCIRTHASLTLTELAKSGHFQLSIQNRCRYRFFRVQSPSKLNMSANLANQNVGEEAQELKETVQRLEDAGAKAIEQYCNITDDNGNLTGKVDKNACWPNVERLARYGQRQYTSTVQTQRSQRTQQ
jgi:hypothetical protein